MKTTSYHWDHPLLKPHLQPIEEGQFLFTQGDSGEAMYILITGVVALTAAFNGKESILNIIEAGEMIGEQALFQVGTNYKRAFSVKVMASGSVIKISRSDLDAIQKKDPHLMADLQGEMFRVAAQRLVRANEIARILRSSNNVDRLINMLIFFSRRSRAIGSEMWEVRIPAESIRYYIDMQLFEMEEVLNELSRRKILIPQGNSFYLIPNPEALRREISSVKEALPTIPVI